MSRGIAPFILKIGARSSSMVYFTSRSLYPRGKSAVPAGKDLGCSPEPVWMVLEKTKIWTAIEQRGVVIYYRRSGTTHRSRIKDGFFFDFEDGTDRFTRNVGSNLPLLAA